MNITWRASAVDRLFGITMYCGETCTRLTLRCLTVASQRFHTGTHQQDVSHDSPVHRDEGFAYKRKDLKGKKTGN